MATPRVGLAFFLRLQARIFFRKLELRLLCNEASTRYDEIDRLGHIVGHAFNEQVPNFTYVHMFILNNTGHATDEGERINSLCWDSPIALTVHIDELPCLGLGIELRGKVLSIRQMQGVRGAQPLANLKDWPTTLVRCCMAHAEAEGLDEVRVYKADQDLTYEAPYLEEGLDSPEAIRKHQDRMRRRYDRTASDLGFEKKKRYYVWRVPTAQPA